MASFHDNDGSVIWAVSDGNVYLSNTELPFFVVLQ